MSQTTLASSSLKLSVLIIQFGTDDAACECICNIPSHKTSDEVWRQGLSVSQTWRQLAADDQIDEICSGFFMLCTKESCIWFVQIKEQIIAPEPMLKSCDTISESIDDGSGRRLKGSVYISASSASLCYFLSKLSISRPIWNSSFLSIERLRKEIELSMNHLHRIRLIRNNVCKRCSSAGFAMLYCY